MRQRSGRPVPRRARPLCTAALLTAALLATAVTTAAAPPGTPPQPAATGEASASVPISALTTAIMVWVAGELGQPLPAALPAIGFAEPDAMAGLRAPGGVTQPGAGFDVIAVYDTIARTIYLPVGWTGDTPEALSVLVHEMVHHLQAASGARFACPAAREKAAFALQDRFLHRFGRDLETAFGTNALFLLVATNCMP